MFRLLERFRRPPLFEVREMLFGDVPLEDWKASGEAGESTAWAAFDVARDALADGDERRARAALRSVVDAESVATRHQLQAWHALRHLGIAPNPPQSKQVLDVVLEVALEEGLDTLAAYSDHTARYINYTSKLIVWETPQPAIDALVDSLLAAGQRVVDVIGVWTEPRRPPPRRNHVRLNMLTPSGLHFGEGRLDLLTVDLMGGPVIAAGTRLMKALIDEVTA